MSGVNSKCDRKSITGGSSNDVSVAVGPRAESLPPIFKLNVDCFEGLFEWLSLKDLKTLRRTCKRMKQVVDYYIRLIDRLREISLCSNQLARFHDLNVGKFGLVNYMILWAASEILARLEVITQMFGHVEFIDLRIFESVKWDFHKDFLKHFTHLKHLMVRGTYATLIENGNEWMLRKYPTLEHIGIDSYDEVIKCTELRTFFEQNPNVRTFSTTIEFLLANEDWILESNIRLERLDIWGSHHTSADKFGRFSNLLDKLHERKFYQILHLYYLADWFDQENMQIRNTSLRAIERLVFFDFQNNQLSVSFLNNIKELIIYKFEGIQDLDIQTLANNLTNVQRVRIGNGPIGTLLPFIRGCPRLRQIRISGLKIGTYFKGDIIDLVALNNERAASFPNARKMTIFIPEDLLLKNKWKQNINLRLIELERASLWRKCNPFFEEN